MHLFNIFTILMMALLTAAAPQIRPEKRAATPAFDITPVTPFADTSSPQCAKEPHCVLITYNTMKQIELDNTSCTNLFDGIVYGVLVAKCTCYIYNGYNCATYIDTFKDCPGLKGPDFKNGLAVKSIRCVGQ